MLAKCWEHGIIFQVLHLDGSNDYCDLISLIVYQIILPASRQVKMKSEQALVSSIKTSIPAADVYLLIDGDHTLCPQDTGTLFFDQVSTLNLSHPLKKNSNVMKTIHSSKRFGKCQCFIARL